jgi:uncharacterized SAM-dependent methyltransferase
MNRELGADFKLEQFDFYSFYDPNTGEVKSYLVSLVRQKVTIEVLSASFAFAKNELIYTELSKKYSIEQIASLAEKAGFILKNHILDSNDLFAECILVKV